jgi:hypothetical protein
VKLYELTAEYLALAETMTAEDGELSPEVDLALDRLSADIDAKVDGICRLVKQFRADGDAATNECQRLKALANSRYNAATRLLEYLKRNLEMMGADRYDTPLWRVRVQANSRPAISWERPLDELPEELRRTEVSFDSQAAYALWKNGIPPRDGVKIHLGSHLRIS